MKNFDRFTQLSRILAQGLPGRELSVHLGLLALLSGESFFLLGPPGVAKSLVARRLKYALKDSVNFEYLMGRFSTPEEIFGPLSISALKDKDEFVRKTQGYLPSADVAFLDELWRSGPAIQNTLLTILNEKLFRNGAQEFKVPLKLFVGASNSLPQNEENAQAFWDRFLIRMELAPLSSGTDFKEMLRGKQNLFELTENTDLAYTTQEWESFQLAKESVVLPELLLEALDELRNDWSEVVYVSDRRWKKSASLLKSLALIQDHDVVDSLDLVILKNVLWQTPDEREKLIPILKSIMEDYGWTGPADLDKESEVVQTLENRLQTLTKTSRKITQPQPVLYEGEYFSVLGYPGPMTARVWAQDYALWTTNEEVQGEIFFFKPAGAYVENKTTLIRRGDDQAEVILDGILYSLESQPVEIEEWIKVTPDPQAFKAWKLEVQEQQKNLKDLIKATEDFKLQKIAQAQVHPFANEEERKACASPLELDLEGLEKLLVRLEELNPRSY